MAARATKCPHCHTSFRVTEAQLATARGLVRCGACLEVFNAPEHWLETEPARYADTAEETRASDKDEFLFDDENGLPDEDEAVEPGAPADIPESATQDICEDRGNDQETVATELQTAENTSPAAETEPGALTEESTSPSIEDRKLAVDDDDIFKGSARQLRISRQELGWGLLSCLAALTLAAQILYTNFNVIAQSSYRAELGKLCAVVNFIGHGQHCTLPPPQNLALINSRGLNIFSHPTFANSLLIDALIVNQAAFEQPFPIIELAFHDHNDRPVASRRFTPAEYLAGALSGAEFMPSRQTVHINISILDPGATAVNYEMRFHPANSGSPGILVKR